MISDRTASMTASDIFAWIADEHARGNQINTAPHGPPGEHVVTWVQPDTCVRLTVCNNNLLDAFRILVDDVGRLRIARAEARSRP